MAYRAIFAADKQLDSNAMKYRNFPLAKILFSLGLMGTLFAFTTRSVEVPEGAPLFITSIAPCPSGMVVSEKGVKKVTVYSSDYKERLQEWSLDEVPTGVAVQGERIVVTLSLIHI